MEFRSNDIATYHIKITLISKRIEQESRAYAHPKENSKIFKKLINFTNFTLGNKDLSLLTSVSLFMTLLL